MSERIINYNEVIRLTGQSRAGIWRLVKAGRFPAPIDLGTGRRVGFFEDEIQAWIENRPRVSYGGREAA